MVPCCGGSGLPGMEWPYGPGTVQALLQMRLRQRPSRRCMPCAWRPALAARRVLHSSRFRGGVVGAEGGARTFTTRKNGTTVTPAASVTSGTSSAST